MIHTEAERQFYLGIAGVSLWYARSPLPGAAPSPTFEFPEPESAAGGEPYQASPEPASEVHPAAPRSPSGKKPGTPRAVNLQSLMETPAPEPPGAASTQLPSRPEAAAASEPADAVETSLPLTGEVAANPFRHKLNLRLWFGQNFVLVSDLSAEASLRLQEALAENILKSIGDPEARVTGPVLWPVFNNPLLPGNRLPDLVTVLKGVLEPLGNQRVILLGVPGQEDETGEDHWFAQALGRKPELVFPHSLAELAGNPGLKKNLWQRLKPFAR